jgi:neutral ceramidase
VATAGFHKVDITPEPGVPLAGFAARQAVSTGVHDRLFARALAIEQAGRTAVFVAVDVLGLAADFVRRVRAAIAERTDLARESVMISSTHTHSAPVTVSTFFNPGETLDHRYMDRLAAAIEAAVCTAWEHRAPAAIGVGSTRVSGIGRNRRTDDGLPIDDEVGIINVSPADGGPGGVLINHACHPTVLGPDNLLMTGDFPAFAIERIESRLGAGSFALFVNGAQGNISMGHSSELSAIGIITPGRTFERAEALGDRLADAVLDALPSIAMVSAVPVSCAARVLQLPFNAYPPTADTARALDEAESELETLVHRGAALEEIGAAKTRRLYASIRNFYAGEARALPKRHLSIEMQAFRIAGALFAAVPGELFVEIALRIKRRLDHPVFIMGITNGYIGYLPTREAYASGGYEVVSAKVTDAAEDLVVGAIEALNRQLFPERG